MARERRKYVDPEHVTRLERLKAQADYIDLAALKRRFSTSYDVWYNMTDDRPRGRRRDVQVLPSLRIGETKVVKISDLARLLSLTCNLPETAREDFDIADLVARTCVPDPPKDAPEEKRVEPLHWFSPDEVSEILKGLYSGGYIVFLIGQGRIGAVKIGPRLWRIPEPEVQRVTQGKFRAQIKIQRIPSLQPAAGRRPLTSARSRRPRGGRKS